MPRYTRDGFNPIETNVPAEGVQLRAEGWAEETVEELEVRTAADLKEELKALGLPTTGKKEDLVARLAESTSEAPAES